METWVFTENSFKFTVCIKFPNKMLGNMSSNTRYAIQFISVVLFKDNSTTTKITGHLPHIKHCLMY